MSKFVMRTRRTKKLRITERDFLLANRKAAREEDIQAHGKPIIFRKYLYKSKKTYNRKQSKQTIIVTDDGFYVMPGYEKGVPKDALSTQIVLNNSSTSRGFSTSISMGQSNISNSQSSLPHHALSSL